MSSAQFLCTQLHNKKSCHRFLNLNHRIKHRLSRAIIKFQFLKQSWMWIYLKSDNICGPKSARWLCVSAYMCKWVSKLCHIWPHVGIFISCELLMLVLWRACCACRNARAEIDLPNGRGKTHVQNARPDMSKPPITWSPDLWAPDYDPTKCFGLFRSSMSSYVRTGGICTLCV